VGVPSVPCRGKHGIQFVDKAKHLPNIFPNRSKSKGTSGGDATISATWLRDQYQDRWAYSFITYPAMNPFLSKENICCVMGYIVDLTVVLSGLFESTEDVSPGGVQSVIKDLVTSGRKTSIHDEICDFVRAAPTFTYHGHDLIMEKIIDLIRQFCVLPTSNRYI